MPHHWFRGFRIPDPEDLQPLPLVTREEWGALPASEVRTSDTTFKTVAFAFDTGMDTCLNEEHCSQAVKELQKKHMDQGHPDIFYHFAIGGDGRVYEGRGWKGRNDDASVDVKNGRTLVVGIVGKGVDQRREWYPPFEYVTKKLIKHGVQNNLLVKRKLLKIISQGLVNYTGLDQAVEEDLVRHDIDFIQLLRFYNRAHGFLPNLPYKKKKWGQGV